MTRSDALPSPPNFLQRVTLLLDLDGTLVEVAARPDGVRVSKRLRYIMTRLSDRLGERLAIVSGRPAGQVRTMFDGLTFAVAGSHGAELFWPDGRKLVSPLLRGRDIILRATRELAGRFPGVLVEDKPFGVALHYRLAPDAQDKCHALAGQLAADHGLALQPGKMVIELKLSTADKGVAVRNLMRETPMVGTSPIFVGDDDTDEAGFRAALDLHGAGVRIGAPAPTAAIYGLANVAETLQWLEFADFVRDSPQVPSRPE